MSAYDILLYSTVDEGAARRAIRTNITAATFQIGEPVIIDGSGELVDAQTGPGANDPVSIFGITVEPAVSRSNMMAVLEIEDTVRTVELPNEDKLFVARYFSSDGTGATLSTPTYTDVGGVLGNLIYNVAATRWSFDTAAANLNCEGVDVIDSNGNRLGDDLTNSVAGSMVLFRFV